MSCCHTSVLNSTGWASLSAGLEHMDGFDPMQVPTNTRRTSLYLLEVTKTVSWLRPEGGLMLSESTCGLAWPQKDSRRNPYSLVHF